MSQLAVERALGRLVTDADFRTEFFGEPASVCRGHGLELTPGELSALTQVDEHALKTLATRLDPKIVRAMTLRVPFSDARFTLTRPPRGRRSQRGVR